MDPTRHETNQGFLNPIVWVVYSLIASIGIPWYWGDSGMSTFLGFPLWVVVSIAASIAASIFTAGLIWKRWPSDADEELNS